MAAQEIHYASMAQVVEVSPQASELTRDTKKPRSITAFPEQVVPSAWTPSAPRWSQAVGEPYQGFGAGGY